MGVAITELMVGEEIDFKFLKDKVIAIDAFNIIYQFLTTLRGPDGSPLQNSKGQITSHIQGLLSRNLQFLKSGIKPIYIFDGEAPELKKKERERRNALKEEAKKLYEIAKERNDLETMRKYSSRIISINKEIIESSKQLLDLMGIPYVDAPSEGEAQAAKLVKNNLADYVVSQDADAFIFGSPNLIRNLSVAGKKKKKGKLGIVTIQPVLYDLNKTLKKLELNYEQLVVLAILVGTDFNIGGIKGLGPKKALKKVKEYGNDFNKLFKEIKWDEFFDYSWEDVFNIFTKTNTNEDLELIWNEIDEEKLNKFLIQDYGFSEERLNKSLNIIKEIKQSKQQKGLGDFF